MAKKKESKKAEPDTTAEADELESALAGDVELSTETTEPAETVEPDPVDPVEPEQEDPNPEGEGPIVADTFADTKKASDKARNDRITKETENFTVEDITEEEAAAYKEKQELQLKLHECAEKIEEHEEAIKALKTESRDVMASLYPQNVKSDRHVDAVRSYLKSADNERKNRGANPARLKEMLRRMAQSPVDAAFHRSRARGAGRPTRTVQGSQSGAEE